MNVAILYPEDQEEKCNQITSGELFPPGNDLWGAFPPGNFSIGCNAIPCGGIFLLGGNFSGVIFLGEFFSFYGLKRITTTHENA